MRLKTKIVTVILIAAFGTGIIAGLIMLSINGPTYKGPDNRLIRIDETANNQIYNTKLYDLTEKKVSAETIGTMPGSIAPGYSMTVWGYKINADNATIQKIIGIPLQCKNGTSRIFYGSNYGFDATGALWAVKGIWYVGQRWSSPLILATIGEAMKLKF